jgi:hypothetical protein
LHTFAFNEANETPLQEQDKKKLSSGGEDSYRNFIQNNLFIDHSPNLRIPIVKQDETPGSMPLRKP